MAFASILNRFDGKRRVSSLRKFNVISLKRTNKNEVKVV
jgi:hypothetical protein